MTITIKNRWSGAELWTGEAADLRDAVQQAIAAGSDLRDSDLRGSDLSGSDLRDSDLRGSDLRGSNLSGSDLRDSNLSGSDLSGSDLSGSNLRGSNLSGSDLTPIRDDVWAVLASAPAEAEGLLAAIREGRIDGTCYSGACACLVGTLANVRGCAHDEIAGLRPSPSRPAERWFLSILPGDTPETSQFAALAAEWVAEWVARMRTAFGGTTT